MKKIGSKWIGSVKKKAGDFLEKKEGKDGKEIKEGAPVVAEDPAVILEEVNLLEESSEDVLNIDENLSTIISALREALKRVSNSTRQLITVGKHFSKEISDTAIEKQLVAGYENLNSWGETLIAETKKLAHALIATKPQIKALTVKKLLKICKYTCQATTILLVAVKSVAAFDAENENVQKKVAMSTRALRDAVQQLVTAWEAFPTNAIADLDVVGHIGPTAKQIISMCDNVESVSGIAGSSIVTLTSTRSELIAACRATAAATTRLIYAQTNGKYKSTSATTTLKVIVSSTTQVLTVTTNISSILFKQDENSALKILLGCAAQSLKKAVDRLDDTGKETSLRLLRSPITVSGESIAPETSLESSDPAEPAENKEGKSGENAETTKPAENGEANKSEENGEDIKPEENKEADKSAPNGEASKSGDAEAGKPGDPEELIFPDEPSKLSCSTRSVSQPIVSLSGSTIVNVKRAFTTAPPVTRSSTFTSPQRPSPLKQISCDELTEALKEIQSLIENQATSTSNSVPDNLIFARKKSNSVEEPPNFSTSAPAAIHMSSTPPTSSPVMGFHSQSSSPCPSPLNTSSDGTGSKIHKPLPPIPTRHPLPPVPPHASKLFNKSSSDSTLSDAKSSPLKSSSDSKEATPTDTSTSSDANITNGTSASDDKTTPNSLSISASSISRSDSPAPRSPTESSPREGTPTSPLPSSAPVHVPTTPSELNETLSWSVKAEGARNPRISMRVNPAVAPGVTPLSPPLSPVGSPEPIVVPVRKATIKKDDMTLYKLFELIPTSKEEQLIPHASKKLLKMLVALVAAYSTAIDMGIAEIKDITARAQSELPRPISSFNISVDSATPIANQYLLDALHAIETSIPAPPLTPPPQPAVSADHGRQSGDAGVEIWSEPPDEEGVNVLSNEAGKIRAGTLNKLVERLTSPTEADLKFMKTFITTYRSFCTPEILLQKIMQRFDVPTSEAASELPIRLRVCNVLRQWVENQYLDFDEQLIETLTAFIEEKLVNHKSYKTFATSILNTIVAKKHATNMPRVVSADLRTDSKGIQLSPSRLLFVFDEEEIAKQLTLIDFSIYSAIQPVELLNLAWSAPKYKHRAPHVMALIARANLLSNWVASVVLWQPKLRDRVKIIAKLINIAKHLRDLNNFNSLVAVLAGLNNSAIFRLKFAREDLPKQSQETFKELEEVMNVNASYRTYRNLLRNVNPPCLPFLGVYLTDLTFIEEGNPDYIKNLINFGKRELVYNILAEIQQYQLTPYVFPLVDNIASFLDQLPHIQGDKDMYNLSLLREPRDATRESII